jgi:hypothetical protein
MFIKKFPYICQQTKKKHNVFSKEEKIGSEIFLDTKPNTSPVFVLQKAQQDFTLVSKHRFIKHQYILHHTCTSTICTTKKSCEHFFDNIMKSHLYYDICSGMEVSLSQLSCFIKFSKNPNCFLVKRYVNEELNFGLYALRDICEGEELSICSNFDNLLEIFNEFNEFNES